MKSIIKLLPVFLFVIHIHAANAAPKESGLLLTIPPILAAQSDTTQPPPTTVVKTVVSAGGQIWMDRNLGASRVARSPTDSAAYGDLYQWGRLADGHEKRTSLVTNIPSTSDIPGHGKFILWTSPEWDWRTPQNNNLWQGVNGKNNPCPSGFRVPTHAEWMIERNSWSNQDANAAFASPLKLTLAGCRGLFGGKQALPAGVGREATYQSSTLGNSGHGYLWVKNYELFIYADVCFNFNYQGQSVRCIKD